MSIRWGSEMYLYPCDFDYYIYDCYYVFCANVMDVSQVCIECVYNPTTAGGSSKQLLQKLRKISPIFQSIPF